MQRAKNTYIINLVKLAKRDYILNPLAVTFHLTSKCNLNCIYCEDFGAQRNPQSTSVLKTHKVIQILEIIRSVTDKIIFTGGEPLLHPNIEEIIKKAKDDLQFRQVSLLTNGLLLHKRESLLPDINRLVVSLDTVDVNSLKTIINLPKDKVTKIIENVKTYSQRQEEFGYRMVINCVLTLENLAGVEQLIDFCRETNLSVSFSPQGINNWPSYDLLVSPEYKNLIAKLILLKKQGAPILGSHLYFNTLAKFKPFKCLPTLIPRVMPNGDLVYPCRPIEKQNGSHGGRTSNLLEAASWEEAITKSVYDFGKPPRMCTSCFQQCFAEPSLMQARPFSYLRELVSYPSSRKADLGTYSPG